VMSGRALLSGRIMKSLLEQGYDIHWILSGTSQEEEITKLKDKLQLMEELLQKAYKQ